MGKAASTPIVAAGITSAVAFVAIVWALAADATDDADDAALTVAPAAVVEPVALSDNDPAPPLPAPAVQTPDDESAGIGMPTIELRTSPDPPGETSPSGPVTSNPDVTAEAPAAEVVEDLTTPVVRVTEPAPAESTPDDEPPVTEEDIEEQNDPAPTRAVTRGS
ncbi:MAG: hypothetical protein DK306_001419 [Chloroflexi bacterium]|jgi:hypothetical protein|nr:MAG: hypothetical protein DK306_001419 [Chloroflexota bacterium]